MSKAHGDASDVAVAEKALAGHDALPDAKILAHSHDADVAMQAFAGHAGEVIHIDEATNKRLLRIIDWNLMPIMCVVYGLNFLDKTTISYASIMGIKKDIHLIGDDYQWLGSMFYFGYIKHWLIKRFECHPQTCFESTMPVQCDACRLSSCMRFFSRMMLARFCCGTGISSVLAAQMSDSGNLFQCGKRLTSF